MCSTTREVRKRSRDSSKTTPARCSMSSCSSRTSCPVSTGLMTALFIAACSSTYRCEKNLVLRNAYSELRIARRACLQLFAWRRLLCARLLYAELRQSLVQLLAHLHHQLGTVRGLP